jgi:hypothetical protein
MGPGGGLSATSDFGGDSDLGWSGGATSDGGGSVGESPVGGVDLIFAGIGASDFSGGSDLGLSRVQHQMSVALQA